MEKQYPCKVVEIALECPDCQIAMLEYNPYQYFTYKYYYKCPICEKSVTKEKTYPYQKFIRLEIE